MGDLYLARYGVLPFSPTLNRNTVGRLFDKHILHEESRQTLYNMRIFLIAICSMFCTLTLCSQTFTEQLRKEVQGEGKVTVTHSAEIERLVNAVPAEKKEKQEQTTAKGNAQKTTAQKATEQTAKNTGASAQKHIATPAAEKHHATERQTPAPTRQADNTSADRGRNTTVNVADTAVGTPNKKMLRNGQKVTGYRIQIYSGGNRKADRQECEKIAARIKRSFPNLPVYVHFYSPSWKCRAGNFTDYNEAKEMLKEIKDLGYTHACIVKGTITVPATTE